jgi:hypothetical protein
VVTSESLGKAKSLNRILPKYFHAPGCRARSYLALRFVNRSQWETGTTRGEAVMLLGQSLKRHDDLQSDGKEDGAGGKELRFVGLIHCL